MSRTVEEWEIRSVIWSRFAATWHVVVSAWNEGH